MTRLNQPLHLKSLSVPNRIVRSATWEGLAAKDGAPTAALAAFLGRLVAGGAGLVITGFAFVHPCGKVAPQMLGAESEQRVGDLRRLAEGLHRSGRNSLPRSCRQNFGIGGRYGRPLKAADM